WWLYGERRYGEACSQAAEVGYATQTLYNAASIASRIEISRRRENLSFSHHAEVAYLERDEQETLLDKAEENGWTRNDLRQAVRLFKRNLRAIEARADEDESHPGTVLPLDLSKVAPIYHAIVID